MTSETFPHVCLREPKLAFHPDRTFGPGYTSAQGAAPVWPILKWARARPHTRRQRSRQRVRVRGYSIS